MAAHTPVPWHGYADTGNVVYYDKDKEDVTPLIATVNSEGVSEEQYLADLALISASPDLLSSLKDLHGWLCDLIDSNDINEDDRVKLAAADAAIEKAEGR